MRLTNRCSRMSIFLRSLVIPVLAITLMPSPAIAQNLASPATPSMQTRSDTGAAASISGTVYDSVAHEPLGGAQVQFVDAGDHTREYTVRADSTGRFHIDAVRPGQYIAGFFHPSVDALGIEPPLRSVTISAGSPNVVDLVIPGPARIMTAVCGDRTAGDSTGAIAGVVRDADSGLPIAGAKVVVTWLEIVIDQRGLVSEHRRVPAQTDADGGFRLCGLPGADTVLASAELSGRRSGVIGVAVPAGGILRRDFTLGDSASAIAVIPDSTASAEVQRQTTVLRGSAMLSGVVNGPDGKPMPGARILVWGTGLEATTNGTGRFSLAGLPAGTFSVEARSIGFEPRLVAVDLSSRSTAAITIALKDRVHELSRVVVMGKASRTPPDIEGFLQRSRSGMGHYITAADNALKNAFAITDAMRMTPGVRVVPSGSFGHVILLRGGCVPSVYVDGVQMGDGYETVDDIPPQQVAGIEIYAGSSEAPVQYRTNGCGVILVWTKR